MNKDRGENLLKYKGPTSLKGVEERLLEIEYEKPMRIHNIEENFPRGNDIGYEIEIDSIAYLETEKSQLQLKRQFILDGRDSWKAKSVWNVIVPIIVSIVTTYIMINIK